MIIIVTGSWSFDWFGNFSLLFEFAIMLNLRLAEFCELIVEL
jgi:hypothetical protein